MVTARTNQKQQQRDIFQIYPHLAYVEDKHDSTWQQAVSLGNEALMTLDSARFRFGDLTLKVIKAYGNRAPRGSDLVGDFAQAVGVDPDRLREYTTVSKFWEAPHRNEMLRLRLTYTHMRDAMRLGDVLSAKAFLIECADNKWGVKEARERIKKRLGITPSRKKLMSAQATLIQQSGTLHLFQIHQDPDEAPVQLPIGGIFDISIYEPEE